MLEKWHVERWRTLVGAVCAALAIAIGLVLINACGLGDADENVPPPPIVPAYTSVSGTSSATTTPAFTVPPSPTWEIADETTPPASSPTTTTRTVPTPRTPSTRRSLTTSAPAVPTPGDEDEEEPAR